MAFFTRSRRNIEIGMKLYLRRTLGSHVVAAFPPNDVPIGVRDRRNTVTNGNLVLAPINIILEPIIVIKEGIAILCLDENAELTSATIPVEVGTGCQSFVGIPCFKFSLTYNSYQYKYGDLNLDELCRMIYPPPPVYSQCPSLERATSLSRCSIVQTSPCSFIWNRACRSSLLLFTIGGYSLSITYSRGESACLSVYH